MKVIRDEGVPRGLAKALRSAGIEADPYIPMHLDGTRTSRVDVAGETVVEAWPPVSTFKG